MRIFGGTITAAAEPSLTPEQSKIPSGPATRGEPAMVSFATSFRNCARGFSALFVVLPCDARQNLFHGFIVKTVFVCIGRG